MGASPSKKIAYCAMATALLIAVQVALGAVAGVELVTVTCVCLFTFFGPSCGVIIAISFSILRCLIWGFYPSVMILYAIYYPAFALAFGFIGKIDGDFFRRAPLAFVLGVNLFLSLLGGAAAVCAGLNLIKVSRLYAGTVKTLFCVISAICGGQLLFFNAAVIVNKLKKKGSEIVRLVFITSVAAAFTVAFTLLDDVITPLFYGMDGEGAAAYFYASFTAMLPQVVCCIASVSILFYPVTAALYRAVPALHAKKRKELTNAKKCYKFMSENKRGV